MPEVRSRADLHKLQRTMFAAVSRPLSAGWRMRRKDDAGRDLRVSAAAFIKPNDRLTSFERLEIYNRQYWFRLLDCLYDDYPGLRAVLGERRFLRFAIAYLRRHPSTTFALRDLGASIEKFLRDEPIWRGPRPDLAVDMARFEWAQIVAFDAPSRPPVGVDTLLDAPFDRLRLALQPHLTLLECRYPVDEYFLALKAGTTDGLRGEASNALHQTPSRKPAKRIPLPRKKTVHLAIHRSDNQLYYKRLAPEAFAILRAIAQGCPLEQACFHGLTGSTRPEAQWPDTIRKCFTTWTALGWLCER